MRSPPTLPPPQNLERALIGLNYITAHIFSLNHVIAYILNLNYIIVHIFAVVSQYAHYFPTVTILIAPIIAPIHLIPTNTLPSNALILSS